MGNKLSCSAKNTEDMHEQPYVIAEDRNPCVEAENVYEECSEKSDGAECKQQNGKVINFYTIKANHVNVAISDGTIQGSSESISSDQNESLPETMPVQASNYVNGGNNPWVEQVLAEPSHTIKETCEQRPCMEVPPLKFVEKNVQSNSLPETIPVQVSNDLNVGGKTWEDKDFAEPNQTVDETCMELKSSKENLTDKIIQSIKTNCEDLNCNEEHHSANKKFPSYGSCEEDSPFSLPNYSDKKSFPIVCIRAESISSHGSRDESEMQIKQTVNNTCQVHPDLHKMHDEHLFGSSSEKRPAKHSANDNGNDGQAETGYNVDGRDGQNDRRLDGNDDGDEDTSRVTEDRQTGGQQDIICDELTQHNLQDDVENEGEQSQNERSCENREIADAIEEDAETYSEEFDRESVKEGDKDGKSTSKNYILEWVSDSMTKLSDLSKEGIGKVHSIAETTHESNDEVKIECAKEIGKTTRNGVDNMANITKRVAIQYLPT